MRISLPIRTAAATLFVLSACSLANAADPGLNDRWFGTWTTADGSNTINISAGQLKEAVKAQSGVSNKTYAYSNNVQSTKNGCVFGYAGKMRRADISALVDRLRAGVNDKNADAATKGAARKALAESEKSLKEISQGNFKMVVSACFPDESGDVELCSGHYILDKDALYQLGTCEPAGYDGFFVKRMSKK